MAHLSRVTEVLQIHRHREWLQVFGLGKLGDEALWVGPLPRFLQAYAGAQVQV